MNIDWSTVIFQMINFIILVLVLKKYLYKPVISAMDSRQKTINEKLNSSAEKEKAVEKELAKYEKKIQKFEDEKKAVMADVYKHAADEKKSLLKNLQSEMKGKRDQFESQILAERKMLENTVRRLVGEVLVSESKTSFKELADADLQSKVLEKFIAKLDGLKGADAKKFQKNYDEKKSITVFSSFEISSDQQKEIKATAEKSLGQNSVEVKFKEDKDLICGLEMVSENFVLSFGFNQFINSFEQNLDTALSDFIKDAE